jgi:hypothetical protein
MLVAQNFAITKVAFCAHGKCNDVAGVEDLLLLRTPPPLSAQMRSRPLCLVRLHTHTSSLTIKPPASVTLKTLASITLRTPSVLIQK